jgi:hypothetical protein
MYLLAYAVQGNANSIATLGGAEKLLFLWGEGTCS